MDLAVQAGQEALEDREELEDQEAQMIKEDLRAMIRTTMQMGLEVKDQNDQKVAVHLEEKVDQVEKVDPEGKVDLEEMVDQEDREDRMVGHQVD